MRWKPPPRPRLTSGVLAACLTTHLGACVALPGRDLLTQNFRRRFLDFDVMCNVLYHKMGFW